MSTTTRILTQHDPLADYHAWWMPGRVQWLDTIGRRNRGHSGSIRWHVAECNNSACPALAIIREYAIIALLLAEPVLASLIDRLADAIVTSAGGPMTPVDRPTAPAEAVEAGALAITESMRGRTWLSRSPREITETVLEAVGYADKVAKAGATVALADYESACRNQARAEAEAERLTEAVDNSRSWADEQEARAIAAEAERADLLAEAERLQRIINGYDRTPAEQRAADAEATVARVEALADSWDEVPPRLTGLAATRSADGDDSLTRALAIGRAYATALRAALGLTVTDDYSKEQERLRVRECSE